MNHENREDLREISEALDSIAFRLACAASKIGEAGYDEQAIDRIAAVGTSLSETLTSLEIQNMTEEISAVCLFARAIIKASLLRHDAACDVDDLKSVMFDGEIMP